ncbi:MAG: phosphate-starvation-inducible PsiE family protein [Deltaproteobacteria bacterium]|nr:phosphate-starvation-inducible PsiE family protein [Deltaproteobacteria bacterium]
MKHLKGSKFAINVFISVALVAVIRKILVTSLSSEKVEAQLSLIAAVAVLGVVYWLIAKVEKQ